MNEINPLDPLI